jgi:mono/diheme cytochrome c family protein
MPSAIAAGRATYDARCASCHKAGSYDTSGFASDLRTKGGLLVTNLGSLDPGMAGITLSQTEIDNLQAFFGSL